MQCQAGNPGIRAIRELAGLMAIEGIPAGTFIATGAFSPEAHQLAARSTLKLELVDGPALLQKLAALPPTQSKALLDLAP